MCACICLSHEKEVVIGPQKWMECEVCLLSAFFLVLSLRCHAFFLFVLVDGIVICTELAGGDCRREANATYAGLGSLSLDGCLVAIFGIGCSGQWWHIWLVADTFLALGRLVKVVP